MIYDKNNKYLPSFIINHENTINTIYLVRLLWSQNKDFLCAVVANKRFVKISPPPVMCPREVFAKIARDFQMICFVF